MKNVLRDISARLQKKRKTIGISREDSALAETLALPFISLQNGMKISLSKGKISQLHCV